ncbi:hypothetical protein CC79DRAFT_1331394, partial [Sarocladium strictum]
MTHHLPTPIVAATISHLAASGIPTPPRPVASARSESCASCLIVDGSPRVHGRQVPKAAWFVVGHRGRPHALGGAGTLHDRAFCSAGHSATLHHLDK